jgi:hypothetical protein
MVDFIPTLLVSDLFYVDTSFFYFNSNINCFNTCIIWSCLELELAI